MMDNLIQKLEEKVVLLITEMENLRKENAQLRQENVTLKSSKGDFSKKMQGLLSMLDTLDVTQTPKIVNEPEFIPDREEYATTD